MSPRRLGVSSRIVVCSNAWSARRSRWPTCQYASRANSAEPATAKAISRISARPRESVRPMMVIADPAGSVRADDDRRRQLGHAGVDRQLADCRFLAEPVEVGQELLLANEERVPLLAEALEVVARGRDANALGE